MGLFPLNAPVDLVIAVWPWGAYLGEEGQRNGIRCKVASWRRMSPDSFIPQAKASGQYLNSILAKVESAKAGYDEAIILDHNGDVSEGSGENIFMVSDGELVTPPPSASALDGITARSVVQIAEDLGFKVADARHRSRRALLGRRAVPLRAPPPRSCRCARSTTTSSARPGEITTAIQARFFETIKGKREEYLEWLDFVDLGLKGDSGPVDESQEASASA